MNQLKICANCRTHISAVGGNPHIIQQQLYESDANGKGAGLVLINPNHYRNFAIFLGCEPHNSRGYWVPGGSFDAADGDLCVFCTLYREAQEELKISPRGFVMRTIFNSDGSLRFIVHSGTLVCLATSLKHSLRKINPAIARDFANRHLPHHLRELSHVGAFVMDASGAIRQEDSGVIGPPVSLGGYPNAVARKLFRLAFDRKLPAIIH